MPTVTDTLETVFVLHGIEGGIRDFGRLAKGIEGLDQQAQQFLSSTERLGAALGISGGVGAGQGLALAVQAAVAAFAALAAVLVSSLQAFSDDEQAIFRATIVLNNLKSSLPIAELQEFANELQRTVAIDDEAVVALGGLLAQFGLTGDQIRQAIPAIVDAAKGTGRAIDEIGHAIGRAIQTGRTQGLVGLVSHFKATGDQARDLQTILDQLNLRFQGAGQAERGTLAGTVVAFNEAVSNLKSTIGEIAAPGLISFLDDLGGAIQFLSDHFREFLALVSGITGIPALLGLALTPPGQNPAAQIGNAREPASEDTQEEIARNTKKAADAVTRLILGGGPVGEGVLNIRTLNAAIRSVR